MASNSPWHYLYNTTRWIKGRRLYLAKHPLCVFCHRRGLTQPARVVDHKIPHKGDVDLFFDESNWQGLCKTCHDSVKKAEEQGRLTLGADLSGEPIDTRHPWHSP